MFLWNAGTIYQTTTWHHNPENHSMFRKICRPKKVMAILQFRFHKKELFGLCMFPTLIMIGKFMMV
jgi:hypothetical protein